MGDTGRWTQERGNPHTARHERHLNFGTSAGRAVCDILFNNLVQIDGLRSA